MSLDASELLLARLTAALPGLLSGAAVILATFFAAALARALLRRLAAAEPARVDLIELAATVTFWGVLAFGLVTGLGTMGMDVGALVAGLGLTGFALGFALKDAVANLMAGVLILTYQPFRRGDRIKVAGFEGTVVGLDLRYTVLAEDGERVLIPNQTLFTNAITLRARAPAVTPPPTGT